MKKIVVSFSLFIFLLTMGLFQISCTKSSYPREVNKKYSITGLWIGTWADDFHKADGNLFQSLVVYPDGSLITNGKVVDGQSHFCKGIWALKDSVFTATVTTFYTPGYNETPVTQRIVATFSKNGELINGTWENFNDANGLNRTGTFSTFKKVE